MSALMMRVGGLYRTRSGKTIRLEKNRPGAVYPWTGVINEQFGLECWTDDGCYLHSNNSNPLDLIEELSSAGPETSGAPSSGANEAPSNGAEQFDVVGDYTTRDGRRARVREVVRTPGIAYPLRGECLTAAGWIARSWALDGHFMIGEEGDADLVGVAFAGGASPAEAVGAPPSGAAEAPSNGAKKFDAGKPDLSLLPLSALAEAAYGFMAGEKKYGRWNFLSGEGLSTGRLVAGALRHVMQWASGEEVDPEATQLVGRPVSHLGLAMCNLMMLIELRRRGLGEDNRAPRFDAPRDECAGERGG